MIETRFWDKVRKLPNSCWLWTAAQNGKGYGIFRVNGRWMLAHRFAYELLVGPILEGLTIDHLCRNRACVRPDHLEAVTNHENILRGETGQNNARKTHCPAGHPYSGDNLDINPNGWRECRTCKTTRARPVRALAEGGTS